MLSKKNIFRIILVLIPFGLFFILELILRITGYENDLNFVSQVDRNGKEYYTINQLVGKRYFGKDRLYYRKGSHDYFEVNKSPNTLRVFCFGASTMAGFPFEYNAIPSEFLRDRLSLALPGKNIEVINTAIAATNSYTVDEFADVLVKYKPDLFVVYMGQNEFYGVFGVGSTISAGKNRWVIKTYLWFEQFKTFLLLKNIINSIRGLFYPDDSQGNKILMEQMANNSIRYDSEDFKTAVNTFRDNYDEIINIAREHNIPILISTLVTNESDLHPFVSFHSTALNDSLKKESEELFELGLKEMEDSSYEAAADNFRKSLVIDSIPAGVHYQLGKCYENMGMIPEAERQFSLARDLDGLRFRAPSEFNKIIENLGREYNIPVADAQRQFRKDSKNGLIGSELLVDHVHPNIQGYFLLAKTWFQSLKNNKLLGLSPDFAEDDSLVWNKSSVTPLDSLIGAIKIIELRSRPPFAKTDEKLNYHPRNEIAKIAYQYVVMHKSAWASAHMNAAKYYLSIGNFKGALNELRAVLVSDEDNPMVLKLAGDMSLQINLYEEAEKYYLRANKYESNQFIEYKLGKTELLLGRPRLAAQFLQSSFNKNTQSSDKFNSAELEDLFFNLAQAYSQLKDYGKTTDILKKLLEVNPRDKRAAAFLAKTQKLLASADTLSVQ
jgi:tetratricopeptide (TPR) repeat protein